jgi:polygalacturonase
MKKTIVIILLTYFPLFAQTNSIFSVTEFGAKGDGLSLETNSLQTAIDKCAERGGTVFFPAGKYLTGSLELKSNVEIYLSPGSVILGSTDIKDYKPHKPELNSYNDYFLEYSLFYSEHASRVSIRGEGTIDGQGSAFKVITKKKPDRYRNRPFIIRFVECNDITIENIFLRNSAMWMQQYLACQNLIIRDVKIFNHANQNNDMMDIDGCKNVVISGCIGDTDDDGITLKSTSMRITENVTISDCVVSSHCNAIKIGTESTGGFRNIAISNMVVKPSSVEKVIFGSPTGLSGITLGNVDGGILERVVISNIAIDGPDVPICLRLGNRGRKYKDDAPQPGIGSYKDVSLDNIVADNVKSTGCSITGIPGHQIENISLSNIKINFTGGVSKENIKTDVPELEDSYPEGIMFGTLPSYGFYIRHAKNISFSNIQLSYTGKDSRSSIICNDVDGINITGLKAQCDPDATSLISFMNVTNSSIINSTSSSETNLFLDVYGKQNKNIKLSGNDFTNIKKIHNAEDGIVFPVGNIK